MIAAASCAAMRGESGWYSNTGTDTAKPCIPMQAALECGVDLRARAGAVVCACGSSIMTVMRVFSHTCSNTEIVCALGCAQMLVGVDSDSDYPPDVVAALPKTGRDLDLNIDAVLALKQISISFPKGITEAQATKQASDFAKAMHAAHGCGNLPAPRFVGAINLSH